MLKKELETRLMELGSIKTDLKWIKKAVQNIDKHLEELNGSVGKIKTTTNNHEYRINTIEEDLNVDEEQRKKNKWLKKETVYAVAGSIITGLIFTLISYL